MNIQNRIRRFIEISAYVKNGSIYFSGFTLDKVFYMYKHHDVIEPAKYSKKCNYIRYIKQSPRSNALLFSHNHPFHPTKNHQEMKILLNVRY
jgi:hypothetical protein